MLQLMLFNHFTFIVVFGYKHLAGFNLGNLRIGYPFDMTIAQL